MLCPNCHSQTESYCGMPKPKYYCSKCGRQLKTNAQYCLSCAQKMKSIEKWTERLTNRTESNIDLGKEFGVTEAAIRKWRKKLNL